MKKKTKNIFFKFSRPIFNKLGYQRKVEQSAPLPEGKNLLLQTLFTNIKKIVEGALILKAYINEAIEVEKAGLKVDFIKNTEGLLPEEFTNKLNENAALKTAFNALTPGRQRAYNLYFAAPKQAKTRTLRVEKSMQQILNGKGLND